MSEFMPTDIAGLRLWLKGDALALSDGDAVSSWPDASGQANHVAQDDAAKRPTKQSATHGGKTFAVVRFDGSNGGLATAGNVNLGAAPGLTMFAVSKIIAAANFPMMLTHGGGGTFDLRLFSNTLQSEAVHGATNARAADNVSTTAFHIHVLHFDDAADRLKHYRDGAEKSSLADATAFGSNLPFFVGNRNGSLSWKGDIAELIVYAAPLTDAQRQQVQSYLATRYGVVLA